MSESALNRILQPGAITPVYQPVFRVSNGKKEIHGVECLSRGPRGTNFESAEVLFEYVRLKREESLVDRACIAAAFRGASALPTTLRLGINVHASTLGRDHGFIAFLQSTAAATGIAAQRIVIEIVEHAPPWTTSVSSRRSNSSASSAWPSPSMTSASGNRTSKCCSTCGPTT